MGYQEMLSAYLKVDGYGDPTRVLKARKKLINALIESHEIDSVRFALQKHDGSVTRAAKELGLKTHGWVIQLIKKHPELSSFRKPKRKKSIILK
jgi:hypothetical protein